MVTFELPTLEYQPDNVLLFFKILKPFCHERKCNILGILYIIPL